MTDVLYDMFIIFVLLLAGVILRKYVKFFQTFHIPAALIGGLLGLFLGPQMLGAVAPVHFPIPDSIGRLPGVMICFVLGLALLSGTEQPRNMSRTAVAHCFNAAQAWQFQLWVGLVIAYFCGLFWDIPIGAGFSGIMGFFQGHGNAAAFGTALTDVTGWEDAKDFCITIATTGLLTGIFFGIVMINIALRKGWTQVRELPAGNPDAAIIKTGLVPAGKRNPIGYGVTSADSLDPLAFQLTIPFIIYGVASVIRTFFVANKVFFLSNLPTFVYCMLLGILLNVVLKRTRLNTYLDDATLHRISGVCMEILVCAAMASLSIKVVMAYAVPLLLLTFAFVLVNLVSCFGIAYMTYDTNWFECGVGGYGNFSGVMATGLMLVRTCDPAGETIGTKVTAAGGASSYIYTLPYIALGAIWSVSFSPGILIGVTFALWVVLMLIIRSRFWIKERKFSDLFTDNMV